VVHVMIDMSCNNFLSANFMFVIQKSVSKQVSLWSLLWLPALAKWKREEDQCVFIYLFVYLFIYFAPTILNSREPKYGICLERSWRWLRILETCLLGRPHWIIGRHSPTDKRSFIHSFIHSLDTAFLTSCKRYSRKFST